jgi:DNA-binding protein YbaB
MDQRQRDRLLAEIIEKLEATAAKARRVHTALEGKVIQRTDDNKIVTASANGHGMIVDLQISEAALRHPSILGNRVTVAVTRARRAAQILAERAQERYLPELPTGNDLQSIGDGPSARVDYLAIDYPGSPRVRNALAEAMEAIRDAGRLNELFRKQKVRHEIGNNLGILEMTVSGEALKVTINPGMSANVGVKRLAIKVKETLDKAYVEAEHRRRSALDKVGDRIVLE